MPEYYQWTGKIFLEDVYLTKKVPLLFFSSSYYILVLSYPLKILILRIFLFRITIFFSYYNQNWESSLERTLWKRSIATSDDNVNNKNDGRNYYLLRIYCVCWEFQTYFKLILLTGGYNQEVFSLNSQWWL